MPFYIFMLTNLLHRYLQLPSALVRDQPLPIPHTYPFNIYSITFLTARFSHATSLFSSPFHFLSSNLLSVLLSGSTFVRHNRHGTWLLSFSFYASYFCCCLLPWPSPSILTKNFCFDCCPSSPLSSSALRMASNTERHLSRLRLNLGLDTLFRFYRGIGFSLTVFSLFLFFVSQLLRPVYTSWTPEPFSLDDFRNERASENRCKCVAPKYSRVPLLIEEGSIFVSIDACISNVYDLLLLPIWPLVYSFARTMALLSYLHYRFWSISRSAFISKTSFEDVMMLVLSSNFAS